MGSKGEGGWRKGKPYHHEVTPFLLQKKKEGGARSARHIFLQEQHRPNRNGELMGGWGETPFDLSTGWEAATAAAAAAAGGAGVHTTNQIR